MIEEGGRLRYFHTPDLRAKTLKPIIDRHIRTDVKQIVTDGATVYPWAFDKNFNRVHHTVNHSIMEWVSPEGFTTNHIESAFSLFRRGMIGSFHRVSIKHLHRYLNEFEYKFNARKEPERFAKTVARMVQTKKMPMRLLIDGILPAPEAEQPSESF